MTTTATWEQGSEFHWMAFAPRAEAVSHPWTPRALLCGSGRDALRGLIAFGKRRRGWRRLWLPSYFCQEVANAILSAGLPVRLYPDGPEDPAPAPPGDLARGDALLVVNYFALRGKPGLEAFHRAGVEIIEDHSHDPWSAWARQSEADFCVASLRKTLPVPDGGVAWSPLGHALPGPFPRSEQREKASADKLSAMLLKAFYLQGHPVKKDAFRALARRGEQEIAAGAVSGMSAHSEALLSVFPLEEWWRKKRENIARLAERLRGVPWLRMVEPHHGEARAPFSAILRLDDARRRERVRRRLIGERIYPAVLWSLEHPALSGTPKRHLDWSRRMLSIHADMRYSARDMDRVADTLARMEREHTP